jgi:iron complex transport system substrate-binding protein
MWNIIESSNEQGIMSNYQLSMKKYFFLFAIFFFAVSFVWSNSAIKNKRIISLVPALTEIVFAIGAGDNLVGITQYCNYPEETKNVEKVGGFSGATISIEKIVSLKPDFVLVSSEMHFRMIELLNQVGIASFAFEPKNIEDVFSCITTIGQLTNCEEGAFQTILQMKEKLDKAKSFAAGKERVSVFWEIWDNPLMTSGANTFIDEAINLAGGKNIFDDIFLNWPEVSVEQVMMRNPTWIMSGSDRETQMNQTVLSKRSGWSILDAVRNNRIGIINADMIMRGGPRLADAILQMAELFYKEAERQ